MKNLIKILVFTSLIATSSNAALYSLDELKKHENSLAKDYYLNRLLEKNKLKKQEVKTLRSHIFRYAGNIKKSIEKIFPLKPIVNAQTAACYNYGKNNIMDANLSCQSLRLSSIAFIQSLSSQTRSALAAKLNAKKPELANLLLAFNSKNPMAYVVAKQDDKAFLRLYRYSSKLDSSLSISFMNKLAKNSAFKELVQNIVIKKEHPKLQKSLLEIDPKVTSDEVAFFLGVNALIYEEDALAYEFFKQAYLSFKQQNTKDNALFWMWQVSKNEVHLKELASSNSLNIYSLYARELTNGSLPEIIVPKAEDKKSKFNMQDPFAWQSLAKKLRDANSSQLLKFENEFNAKATLPIYTYILERSSGFKKNYFIMPYFEHLKDYDSARQALILAIGRQESRFIPTAISTSYALGMMQFMPFLANHIAKNELKIEGFDQDDMFKPEVAYYFANHHLDYLEKNLSSPLLISYAYNGGIGFTNRMLARSDMFKPGRFEPFLSMELVPYRESRIYGKKVLANYIVYRHLLNDNIKISSIFESLIQGSQNLAGKS